MYVAPGARRDVASCGGSATSVRRLEPDTDAETDGANDPAGSRFLEALLVAINQASDMRQWYTVTKELQLVSLELCGACRGAHTVHLRVDSDIPNTLFRTVHAPHLIPKGRISSRVPPPRAGLVMWELPSLDLLSSPVHTFAQVEVVVFGNAFNGSLKVRAWPHRLTMMYFGVLSDFNQSIVGVSWPILLKTITFGGGFNQPVLDVTWPASLQQLTFGDFFNQPIEGVKWPMALMLLRFGMKFDQPIRGVKWPASLHQLTLGWSFNQPTESISWPSSLKWLTLGDHFNQLVERCGFPRSLLHLEFGSFFNQPIENVTWPASLRQLTFGCSFDQPIVGVAWPTLLQQLKLGDDFNQPVQGISWPNSLQVLIFGEVFNHAVESVTWPTSLQDLVFGNAFNQRIKSVTWPASLLKIRFGCAFDQPVEDVTWPPLLADLKFGENFDQPIEGAVWPSLRRFGLVGMFWQSLRNLSTAMPALEQFTFQCEGDPTCSDFLRDIDWPVGLTHLTLGTDAVPDGMEIPPGVSVSCGNGFV